MWLLRFALLWHNTDCCKLHYSYEIIRFSFNSIEGFGVFWFSSFFLSIFLSTWLRSEVISGLLYRSVGRSVELAVFESHRNGGVTHIRCTLMNLHLNWISFFFLSYNFINNFFTPTKSFLLVASLLSIAINSCVCWAYLSSEDNRLWNKPTLKIPAWRVHAV